MKVAVAGCGTMGRKFARIISEMQDVKLIGIYNHSPHTAKAFAESLGAGWYSSYDELLAEKELELVIIALPTFLHKAYTTRAAASGKHMLCEKPMALNREDAEDMMRACDRAGVRLFVGHVLRFFPEYREMRMQAVEGAIGKIGVIRAKRASLYPSANSWFADKDKSGGVIFDLMIHEFDYIGWVLGEARSVYTECKRAAGFDYAAAILRFESGAIANIEAVWGHPDSFHANLEMIGSQGFRKCSSQDNKPLVLHSADAAEGVILPEATSGQDPYALEIAHFIDCIRERKQPIVTAEDACKAVAVARTALQSLESGRPIRLMERSGS